MDTAVVPLAERTAAGFADDEDLVLPLPVLHSSDDSDDDEPCSVKSPAAAVAAAAATAAAPPPPPPPLTPRASTAAPEFEASRETPIGTSFSSEYLAEIARRSKAAATRASNAMADLEAAAAAMAGAPAFTKSVRDASELSIDECRRGFVAEFRPLVIRSVGPLTHPSPWSLSFLRERCGQKRAAVNLGGSQMAAACEIRGVEVMTFAELDERIRSQRRQQASCSAGSALPQPVSSVYLYDCSLPLKVPTLCEGLGVPAYFAHDWLQRTRHLHAFSRSWPSLFVGPTGTRSSLHVDQWKGHFWMAQLAGCKRWTIFHPDDLWCLYPTWPDDAPRLEPTFPSLDEMEVCNLPQSPVVSLCPCT